MIQANGAEVELDDVVANCGGEVGAEVAKGKGGGRERLEVVGGTEPQEAVNASLVCAAGGWCDAEQLEVVQSGCQDRVSSAGVVMLHGRGLAWGASSRKACMEKRERWSAMRFSTPGMCATLTWYSPLAARKKRVRTRAMRFLHLHEPLCHICTTAALSQWNRIFLRFH